MSEITETLKNPDPQARLQAIETASRQPASPELLAHLENLAAQDPQPEIRTAALAALETPNLRSLRARRLMKMSGSEQRFILQELENWRKQGLLEDDLARALRSRYQVSDKPAPAPTAQTGSAAAPAPAPATSTESTPAPVASQARPGLAQTLLSEASIKTFLYLGAFFVIAAAAILAALVEVLRLPILTLAALGFGAGALIFKRRLPQPSFVLFIVFSFILPINAGVLADQTELSGQVLSGYWFFAVLACSAIWVFATWFYNSRFFSMSALGAFLAAAVNLPGVLPGDPEFEIYLLSLQFANLAGLGAIFLLNKKRAWPFGQPAFLLGQFANLGLAFTLLMVSLFRLFTTPEPGLFWLAMALSWALAGSYYIFSNRISPFPLFPWMAAAALTPVLFTFQMSFEFGQQGWSLALGLVLWAAVLTFLGEAADRIAKMGWLGGKTRPYDLPFSLAGLALFLIGGLWGLSVSEAWGFGLFAVAATLAGLAHLIRPRSWAWLAALVYALFAYFLFFQLPFLPNLNDFLLYQITAAAMFFLLPDLLLKPDWKKSSSWFAPLRLLAGLLGLAAIGGVLLSGLNDLLQSAVSAIFLSGMYWLCAIRYQKAGLAYLPGFLVAIGLSYGFAYIDEQFKIDVGIYVVSGLAVFYYLVGLLLNGFLKLSSWSRSLRWTGLALTPFLLAAALFGEYDFTGWLAALFGLLFLIETSRYPLLELVAPLLICLGFWLVLDENQVSGIFYYLSGAGLLWLEVDTIYRRLLPRRPLRWLTWGGAGLLGLASAVEFLVPLETASISMLLASLALSAGILAYALLNRQPRLGYGFTLFLALATLMVARIWFADGWAWALVGLAILYYLSSLVDGRLSVEWSRVMRFSGVGLGTLASLGSVFEAPSVAASIPIALAASLWAVEAFRRRNVWLGFPSNALYLMSYFTLLVSLEVSQPQFYSVGAAVLGVLMHWLLMRAGSDKGAFITGLVSQLVLLGTTYIQMVANEQLGYFAALFFQALAVLVYGLVVRSRSLVWVPIAMLVLGVSTIVLFILRGLSTVILIGCTGIVMIIVATLAVVLRERLAQMGERLSGWRA